jgi:hypothetical protein
VAARHESQPAENRLFFDVAPTGKNAENPEGESFVVGHGDFAQVVA